MKMQSEASAPPAQHAGPSDQAAEYRRLPSIDALIQGDDFSSLAEVHGRDAMIEAARTVLADARQAISAGESAPDPEDWFACISEQLQLRFQSTLTPVMNATGVIIHTNLGRAPLSAEARHAVDAIAAGYSNLEYALADGRRGSRHDHARQRLCALTGAEDALIVNNNAAAVYLVLAGLCAGRQVLISRGELVEIGGGFRIPDVLRQSGCHLVEVGATNRTHVADFAQSRTEDTAAIMRVHSSNFRQIGFVAMPSLHELATIAHAESDDQKSLLLIDDLGSGTLLDTTRFGLAPEPTIGASIAAGADIVTFSGDKLLGGPQAGLIVGKRAPIEALRRHPMARALRVDKSTLAALDATLRAYQRGRALTEIPIWQMISRDQAALHSQVQRWLEALAEHGIDAEARPGQSAIGGGSLPGETLPTTLLAIPMPCRGVQADTVAQRLRSATPPIVCRIQQEHLLFDPRTLLPEQEQPFLRQLCTVLTSS